MRECGTCRACCVACSIPELEKAPGIPCEHLVHISDSKAGQCGIYELRPQTCQQFECSWIAGFGDWGDKPNHTGIVAWQMMLEEEIIVYTVEAWKGARKGKNAKKFIKKLEILGLPIVGSDFGEKQGRLLKC